MKRSEMLGKIEHILWQEDIDNSGSLSIDILKAIEDAGMKPPLNSWSFHTDGDHADENNVIYYTWENEVV